MLTGSTVQTALAAVGANARQMKPWNDLASGASDALRTAPNLTPQGAAGFLANCAQESDYFRTTTEYGHDRKRYDPWRGRTLIQVTGESNYKAFGAWCKSRGLVLDADTFAKNPDSLADYRWAWLGAIWYFESTRLWDWANAGLFLAVCQAINGGRSRAGSTFVPNGWSQRKSMYDKFIAQGAALLPGPAPAEFGSADKLPSLEYGMRGNKSVASLQRFLNLYGWMPALPILPVTGNYLDQTAQVLAAAQQQMGVGGGDGRNVGPQTKAALWQRGWRG